MQDRLVGDVADFGKYGLLRFLANRSDGDPQPRLGVVWYLVTTGSSTVLVSTDWLKPRHERRFRSLDPTLYDSLRAIVERGDRTVAAIERSGIFPEGSRFYGVPVPASKTSTGKDSREEWLKQALKHTKDCNIVFLDPDNGLPPASLRSTKHYVFLSEVAPFLYRGQVVVLYQDTTYAGVARLRSGLSKLQDLKEFDHGMVLRWKPWSKCGFYVLWSEEKHPWLGKRVQSLLESAWGREFVLLQ